MTSKVLRTLALASALFAAPLALADVSKPSGLFTSHFKGTAINALYNQDARGGLVRVTWKDLEPASGQYDFAAIDDQAEKARNIGKQWSLAVLGGPSSPAWLYKSGVKPMSITFRGAKQTIPQYWDPLLQKRLDALAQALAARYNNDKSLALVYVPQMTANGVEGHFNGTSSADLNKQGFTATRWKTASKTAARAFATRFSNKALAFEVHDVAGSAEIPLSIINDLWNDPSLNKRVGAAVWWLSGKTTYQKALLDGLKLYPGDIYAQTIGNSGEPARFANNDYTTVFSQAKALNIRYIELWNYEFERQTFNNAFKDYNLWAGQRFGATATGATLKAAPAPGKKTVR